MEIVSGLITLAKILIAAKEVVDAARALVDSVDALIISFRKTVDDAKNLVTEIVRFFDSDGDGVNDSEEVLFRIPQCLPDTVSGFTICIKDNDIGFGLPVYKIIDSRLLPELLCHNSSITLFDDFNPPAVIQDYPLITGNDGYFLADLDNDDINDVFLPAPDLTGDGVNDFFIIQTDPESGLPVASPNGPFYPAGSEGFGSVVESSKMQIYEEKALDKPFADYTVTEALLFLLFIGSAVTALYKIFKRRRY